MANIVLLLLLGFGVGAYGTLIGAGGGFVLMPLLLILYPEAPPETLAAVSLAVVFFNAASGSVAYARQRRIHYRTGLLFSAAGVPGAIVGALTTALIPRHVFDAIFGAVMVAGAAFLVVGRSPAKSHNELAAGSAAHDVPPYNVWLGVGVSFFVGFFSSVLGIGGGILHVPFMVYALKFPVHVATATSHFILAVLALAGSASHAVAGTFSVDDIKESVFIGVGAIAGAQVGALLSRRFGDKWILRGLAVALGIAGVRIFIMAW